MVEIRLGTRGSPLALAQARMTAQALVAEHGWPEDAVELVVIRTTGDRVQDRPLAEIGGKAVFTRELDTAMREGRIDLAVHSMKDVETVLADGIAFAGTLPRADTTDRLVGVADVRLLPPGARLGTSAPRRAAQALAIRPDLRVALLRGNVETRLAKLAAGEVDATLLAAAGLIRLGRDDVGTPQSHDDFLPAPAQGAVGLTARADDVVAQERARAINHLPTSLAIAIERALLLALGGSCRTPIAALAVIDGDAFTLTAEILAEDGSERVRGHRHAALADGPAAARDLADELLARASPSLAALFGGAPSPPS